MLTGYSIPLRHKIIKRWRELEESSITKIAAIADQRLTDIAHSLQLGLITKYEANKRTIAILDGKPVKIVIEQSIPEYPFAEPSGESLMNVHDFTMVSSEVAHWVKGGEPALMKALVDGGFLTARGHLTTKGYGISGPKSRGKLTWKLRSTLKAIGAFR